MFQRAAFDTRLSANVLQDAWEKYAFLTAAAGLTCLMRAPVGTILATEDGRRISIQFIEECEAIAAACGHAPGESARALARGTLLAEGSGFTASMLRDLRAGGRTEARHIVADLLYRGRRAGVPTPLLSVAWTHLQAYEAQRAGT